jgi:acyl carrier protein
VKGDLGKNPTADDQRRSDIANLVIGILKEVYAERGKSVNGPLTKEVRLVGKESQLDSLGLVQLILELEQRIEEQYSVIVTLADERAMSSRNSPFRTVGSLTDYVCELLAQEQTA